MFRLEFLFEYYAKISTKSIYMQKVPNPLQIYTGIKFFQKKF